MGKPIHLNEIFQGFVINRTEMHKKSLSGLALGVSQLKMLKNLKLSMPFLSLEDSDADLISPILSSTPALSITLLLKKNKISKLGAVSLAKALTSNKLASRIKINLSS
jgi:hypothetical protein